jgi:hypothetical protein
MAKMTPEQEAAYAFSNGIARSTLGKSAQLVYDRLQQERQEGARARQVISGQHTAADCGPDGPSSCSGCGEGLTPNARFCASCGEPVSADAQDTNCRGCGEELTSNARFCASCGEPVNIRSAGRPSVREDVRQLGVPDERTLQKFAVKFVIFYDGSGHRLGPSECTLTSRRLITDDARGDIHQIQLRDISGIETPSRMVAPKMLRIKLPVQTYDIDCNNRDQKAAIENWLGQAILVSFT